MTNPINTTVYRPNVGIMLINPDGKIWVGARIDYTSEYWQMPQGGIDENENTESAMWRELFEEIGVQQSDCKILDTTDDWIYYDLPKELQKNKWGGKYKGQKQIWYALRLTAPDSVINIDTEEPEFKKWKWLDADKLVDSIVPFKKEIYKQVLSAFKHHLPQ